MLTLLTYLIIGVIIGGGLFALASALFGRGEQLAPLAAPTSPTQLPTAGMTSEDINRLRFGTALRGYRMSDVDFALDRIADEIAQLRQQLAADEGTHHAQ